MRERSEQVLRLLCVALLALVLAQVVLRIRRSNPLGKLNIPALPALAEATNSASGGMGTNTGSAKAGDSHAAGKGTTNSVSTHGASTNGTNVVARDSAGPGTNAAASRLTGKGATNSVASHATHEADTNVVVAKHTAKGGTNAAPDGTAQKGGTNAVPDLATQKGGTNSIARLESGKGGTNSVSSAGKAGKGTNANSRAEMAMGGMGSPGKPGMGKKAPDLPLPIQARVDRVVDSELFGPVFHPMPAALMGIAGNVAFLRAPSGQTGMVKEGDELGGLKLVRIGINRVLVEEAGNKKELMIFEGLGGQSLESK